jgi:ATP-binding cassette subfamily C protein
MLMRPRLLILDEATAALDPASEVAVWEAVRDLRGHTTVLAISHQSALIEVADRIYSVEAPSAREIAPNERAGAGADDEPSGHAHEQGSARGR